MNSEFKEKLQSLGFFPSERKHRKKETTDELGNTTLEHWDDTVDVTVRPDSVTLRTEQGSD